MKAEHPIAHTKIKSPDTNCVVVPIKSLKGASDLPLPKYETLQSAGVDLMADIQKDIELEPGGYTLIPTGIAIALPNGYEAQIRSRSGLSLKHGVCVLNAPGTIDTDYRGEIKIILCNFGQETFVISGGMRIAQMIFAPFVQAQWQQVELLPDVASRGEDGFGSTGLQASKATQ